MVKKTEAYVDTSALIAFTDRSDTYHSLFRRLFSDPPALVTTPLVVAEGHGWFLRRYDRIKALEFLNLVEAMQPLKILSMGMREQKAATSLLRQGVSLQDIADILRHRSIETTQIYAKVDVSALRQIAQPWPEVQPC